MRPMEKASIRYLSADTTLPKRPGASVFVTAAADIGLTLPKSDRQSKGMSVTLLAETLSSSLGARIIPHTGDTIKGKGITSAASKYYKNTAATDALGDLVTVVSDGDGVWWVTDERGTWAREA